MSDKNRECMGQGVANIATGFIGGMAGYWVKRIPMAGLVAVMIMVSIGTFDWASFRNPRDHPKSCSLVMLATKLPFSCPIH